MLSLPRAARGTSRHSRRRLLRSTDEQRAKREKRLFRVSPSVAAYRPEAVGTSKSTVDGETALVPVLGGLPKRASKGGGVRSCIKIYK